jgi:hypothetical protein
MPVVSDCSGRRLLLLFARRVGIPLHLYIGISRQRMELLHIRHSRLVDPWVGRFRGRAGLVAIDSARRFGPRYERHLDGTSVVL